MKPHFKQTFASLLIVSAGLLLAGCAPQPILQVDHDKVGRFDDKPLSLADMTHAIRLAAFRQEWKQVDVVEPGHIVATQRDDDGKWSVTVDILYTVDEFSIHYKDSQGLKYKAGSPMIDHHYNGAVKDLRDEIRDAIQEIVPGS